MNTKRDPIFNLHMNDSNGMFNPDPKLNLLLEALPDEALTRLLPHLQLVDLALGEVIYEPGMKLKHVHFPLPDCIISMLGVTADGFSTEIAVSGKEGMVGIALFLGGDSSTSRAVVQSAGQAYQLNGAILKEEVERHTELQDLLLRYTQALITQLSLAIVKSVSPAK